MGSSTTQKETRKLRGREFTEREILIIDKLVKKHYLKGRTFISIEVCKKLNWKQPNGWLKDRACREVLRLLDKEKLIKLPVPIVKKLIVKNYPPIDVSKCFENKLIGKDTLQISFSKIKFSQVKGTKNEILWNQIVNEYHYLGFKTFVGRSLKYLIFFEEQIIAAIGFNDPAWQLLSRDNILADAGVLKSDIRWVGINNGRFLILPWVKVPNLASFLLAKAIKIVTADWEKYYSVNPLYIETFVDPKKFLGTCYKADNWILVGKSKGYKKCGTQYSNSQLPKYIFLKLFSKNILDYNNLKK